MKKIFIRKDGTVKEENINPSKTFHEEEDGYHVIDESGVFVNEEGTDPIIILKSGITSCIGSEKGDKEVERSVQASRIGKYMNVSDDIITSTDWGRKVKGWVKMGMYIMVFGLLAYAIVSEVFGLI